MTASLVLLLTEVSAQTFEWQRAAPERHGFDRQKLHKFQDSLAARGTTGLLIIRNDRIFWEWYAEDHGPHQRY